MKNSKNSKIILNFTNSLLKKSKLIYFNRHVNQCIKNDIESDFNIQNYEFLVND